MYTRDELELMSESELAKICVQVDAEFNSEMQSPASMVDFILGHPLAAVAKKAPAKARIRKAVAPEPERSDVPAKPVKSGRKRLIIHNQEGVEASPFVKVQVNGRMYQISREVEVEVPMEVVHVLENAVITTDTRDDRGNHTERHLRRFPFTVLGDAQ